MAEIQQQIADGARPLARVGDVIEHGQDIPPNVVRLRSDEAAGRSMWERAEGGFRMVWSGAPLPVRTPDELRNMFPSRWPMTVVEVDPEPQPAEARCCDGMVRYGEHDRYCPTRHAHLDADGHLRLKGTATGDNQLDPEPQPATSDPGTFAECVAWLIDAGLGSNADRRIDRMAAQHQELQARYDTVVSDRATVRGSLEIVKDRVTRPLCQLLGVQHNEEIVPAVTALLPGAESGPLVLTLPQVPDGAVALVGGKTGRRYEPDAELWAVGGSDELWQLATVLDVEGGVTVEMAPPREPRVWPKLDPAPEIDDLPRTVDVKDHGRWSRLATHHFYPEADPNGAPLTLAGLRELGDVREVLTVAYLGSGTQVAR